MGRERQQAETTTANARNKRMKQCTRVVKTKKNNESEQTQKLQKLMNSPRVGSRIDDPLPDNLVRAHVRVQQHGREPHLQLLAAAVEEDGPEFGKGLFGRERGDEVLEVVLYGICAYVRMMCGCVVCVGCVCVCVCGGLKK